MSFSHYYSHSKITKSNNSGRFLLVFAPFLKKRRYILHTCHYHHQRRGNSVQSTDICVYVNRFDPLVLLEFSKAWEGNIVAHWYFFFPDKLDLKIYVWCFKKCLPIYLKIQFWMYNKNNNFKWIQSYHFEVQRTQQD